MEAGLLASGYMDEETIWMAAEDEKQPWKPTGDLGATSEDVSCEGG